MAALLAALISCSLIAGSDAAGTVAKPAKRCTIKGTPGADRLRGSPRRDLICGRGGDDLIVGRRGNDVLLGGAGADELHGDEGSDQLLGGSGEDVLDGGAGSNSCVAGTSLKQPNFCSDYLTVKRFELGRARVDTSAGFKLIPVEIEIVNTNPDGLPTHQIRFTGENVSEPEARVLGGALLAEGDVTDGVWRGEVMLPEQSPKGVYEIGFETFEGYDLSLQAPTRSITGAQLRASGFESTVKQLGAGHNLPPRILSFEMQREVDTSQSSATVTVRSHIVDETGVEGRTVFFIAGPNGRRLPWVSTLQLESGDAREGNWVGQFELPRHSPPGRYQLDLVSLTDRYTQVHYTEADLRRQGLPPPELTQTGPGDSTPPTLEALSVNPDRIDVTGGGTAAIEIKATVTDDFPGIADWSVRAWRRIDPVFAASAGTGDPRQARTMTFPFNNSDAPRSAGDYELILDVIDAVGNHRRYRGAELAAHGFPSQIHNGP